jgi:hypothetical protein
MNFSVTFTRFCISTEAPNQALDGRALHCELIRRAHEGQANGGSELRLCGRIGFEPATQENPFILDLVGLGSKAPQELFNQVVADGTTAILIILAMSFGLIFPKMCIQNLTRSLLQRRGRV